MHFLSNQYLIIKGDLAKSTFDKFKNQHVQRITWHGFEVYHASSIACTTAANKEFSLLILGYIFDAFAPKFSNQQIADDILKKTQNMSHIFELLQHYSGRYVILISDNQQINAVTDALSARKMYFAKLQDNYLISSSTKILFEAVNESPILTAPMQSLLKTPKFAHGEAIFFGYHWYDERVKLVLPNHYLDCQNFSLQRLKLHHKPHQTEEEIIQYAAQLLSGSIQAAHHRYKIWQTITGGWDSRILLAASKKWKDNTQFYLFKRLDNELDNDIQNPADVKIAQKLSEKLGFSLNVIEPSELKEEFVEEYKKGFLFPRLLTKTKQIQWHYYHHKDKNILNITANGGEIVRCYYPDINGRDCQAKDLIKLIGTNPVIKKPFTEWFENSTEWAKENQIGMLDLFFWEQLSGHWGNTFAQEQDIAIEEFSPFSNKDLLLALLKITPEKRRNPSYTALKSLINYCWQGSAAIPVNPIMGISIKRRIEVFARKVPFLFYTLKHIRTSIYTFKHP